MKTTVLAAALAPLFTVSLLTTARAADALPNPDKINSPNLSTHLFRNTKGKFDLKAGGNAGCTSDAVNVAF